MQTSDALTTYSQLSDLASEMLSAARNDDLHQVAKLEQRCANLISVIPKKQNIRLDSESRLNKIDLLHRIIRIDQLTADVLTSKSARINNLAGY